MFTHSTGYHLCLELLLLLPSLTHIPSYFLGTTGLTFSSLFFLSQLDFTSLLFCSSHPHLQLPSSYSTFLLYHPKMHVFSFLLDHTGRLTRPAGGIERVRREKKRRIKRKNEQLVAEKRTQGRGNKGEKRLKARDTNRTTQ